MNPTPTLEPIGHVESPLSDRVEAPKQGREGAPDAWIVLRPEFADAARDLAVGDEVLVLSWLHLAARDVLRVHPRGDRTRPEAGVFSTRSPDRPNPIGLHRVQLVEADGHRLRVAGLEAIDGTPVVDLKPVLSWPGVAGPPREIGQRARDTRRRLEHEVDAWLSTADRQSGAPYLVPLSFLWDGEALWFATAAATPTARNLQGRDRTRIGIGPTRDVIIVDGTAEVVHEADITATLGDRFAAKTGFDPRQLAAEYLYVRVRPERIQAWREADELDGRNLMVDGNWLA